MTDKQPEALRLADWLEASFSDGDKQAAAELRRLHEVNVYLVDALEEIYYETKHISSAHILAKAALRKATGENND